MPKAKLFLRFDEKYALSALFYDYPVKRLFELMDSGVIPENMTRYTPYLESQLFVALTKSLDEYDKNSERHRRKRALYFKKFADKVSESHMETTVMNIRAAIARVEGTSSRTPLRADKELYALLKVIEKGEHPLDTILSEFELAPQ